MFKKWIAVLLLTGLVLTMLGCVVPDYAYYPQPPYPFHPMNERRYYDDDYPRHRRHLENRDDQPGGNADISSRIDDPGAPVRDNIAPSPTLKESPTSNTPEKGNVPMATRTNRPGRVKSPYPPYSELDITGLPSGSLAKDPTTGQVFRLP